MERISGIQKEGKECVGEELENQAVRSRKFLGCGSELGQVTSEAPSSCIPGLLRNLAPNPSSTVKKPGALKWPVSISGPQESEVVSLTLSKMVLITIAPIYQVFTKGQTLY